MSSFDAVVRDALSRVHPEWNLPNLEQVLRGVLEEEWDGSECAESSDAGSDDAESHRALIAATHTVLPQTGNILRAFSMPPSEVRVLIVGQDPYPTPGHAVGLAFAADLPEGTPLPKSLNNIFTEYSSDLDLPRPSSGDLSPWIHQGVMLLNRVLTVRVGSAGSHKGRGWEEITHAAVQQIAARGDTVAILWGRPAQQLAPLFGKERCVMSPHPSPLSAYRGFFGSRPFSSANALLTSMGVDPVDWSLTR